MIALATLAALAASAASTLPVFSVLVAPPVGPDEECPSARQVTEAMQARFPAFVIVPGEPSLPVRTDVVRALVDVAADGTVVRFSLVDVRGETQLRRTLPAPGRGRPVADCLALADTLATIVERYLGTITYEAPDMSLPDPPGPAVVVAKQPPPPPSASLPPPAPRAALILAGLGWRMPAGQGAAGEIEARIGAEVDVLRTTPRVAAIFSVGVAPPIEAAFEWNGESRTTTLTRLPARVGASLRLPAGPGWVEPAAVVGVDLLIRSATADATGGSQSPSARFAPGLEALVGYRLKIAGPVHLRARAAIGYAIARYDIDVPGGQTIFSTPRAHASFGIDTGVLFQ